MKTQSQKDADLLSFKKTRKEQYEYAEKIQDAFNRGCFFVNASMQVKTGKRTVKIILANLCNSYHHVYVTSLNRKDTKPQLEDLHTNHDVDIAVLKKSEDVTKYIAYWESILKNGKNIMFHIDESDYGSGNTNKKGISPLLCQIYAWLLKEFKYELETPHDVKAVFYSATNEELEFSNFTKKYQNEKISYDPAPTYCGPEWFLDNDLHEEAQDFYETGKGFTDHALDVITEFKADNKAIGVVRLVTEYKDIKNNKELTSDLLKNDGIECVFVDEKNPFGWTDPLNYGPLAFKFKTYGIRTLIFICQTCTRSTEVGFHEHISFWHDYRGDKCAYNTMAQAYGRVFHYHDTGHKIKLYGTNVKQVLQLHANRITPEEYIKGGGILSHRIKNQSRPNRISTIVIDDFDRKEKNLKYFQDLAQNNPHYKIGRERGTAKASKQDAKDVCGDILDFINNGYTDELQSNPQPKNEHRIWGSAPQGNSPIYVLNCNSKKYNDSYKELQSNILGINLQDKIVYFKKQEFVQNPPSNPETSTKGMYSNA